MTDLTRYWPVRPSLHSRRRSRPSDRQAGAALGLVDVEGPEHPTAALWGARPNQLSARSGRAPDDAPGPHGGARVAGGGVCV